MYEDTLNPPPPKKKKNIWNLKNIAFTEFLEFFWTKYIRIDPILLKIWAKIAFNFLLDFNPIRYKFNQTDREVFESTLETALSSGAIVPTLSLLRI